jgi:DNA-binding NarL/FixJ family response regulator
MTNILLVEDSKISRETIESRIARSPDFLLLASIENAANAEIACMNGKIDLILMDVCTADDESGLKAAAVHQKAHPGDKNHHYDLHAGALFPAEGQGLRLRRLLVQGIRRRGLLDVCGRVMAGEAVWPEETPAVPVGSAEQPRPDGAGACRAAGAGPGPQIRGDRRDLGITANTVKYHIKNLLQKTGYRSTLQLVVDVVDKKLILPKY